MTAAGVQNLDSSAYVPPQPSASMPDTKTAGAVGKPVPDPRTADSQGQPSDFQSELESLQAGAQTIDPANVPKGEPEKSAGGKTGKKRDSRAEDPNVSAVVPVQVADVQKQVLPFTMALPQQPDNVQPDETATTPAAPDDHARAAEVSAQLVVDRALMHKSSAKGTVAPDIKRNSTPRESAKPSQNVSQVSDAKVAPAAIDDLSGTQLISVSPVPVQVALQTPVQPQPNQAAPRQQTADSPQKNGPEASPNQAALAIEHDLPAVAPEPVATAVQKTVDAAPTIPPALAFAARMASLPAKTTQAAPGNTEHIAIADSQTPQIPVRYGAMAQIIQSAVSGSKDGSPRRDLGAALGETIRGEARADIRVDMAAPQAGNANQAPQPSVAVAPQAAPAAGHLERVIEPPAAPPSSNHDIRVRVPDNNGGSTQVRFVESGGEVRVSVRTSNDGLAQNLRTHLNDLTQRLADGGIPAEVWKPASNGAPSQNDQHTSNQDDRSSGGNGSGDRGGQNDRQQKRPAWLEEMEASLHAE